MLISDREIWTAAKLLIERHGSDAAIEAARRIDRMLYRGDREGQLVWQRVRLAIAALQAPASGPPN